ncbi:MAG: hypothetical protein GY810_14045 [Aureispira sp.]|nr:hypothetical protein [Aureispira sp.]
MHIQLTNTTIQKLNNELFIKTKIAWGKAILVLFFVILFMITPIIQFFQIVSKLNFGEVILGSIMLILFEYIAMWVYQILAKKTNPKTILITQNELIEYSANFPFPFWNQRVFSILQSQIKTVNYNRLPTDSDSIIYQVYLILNQDEKIPLSLFFHNKTEVVTVVKIIQKKVNGKTIE